MPLREREGAGLNSASQPAPSTPGSRPYARLSPGLGSLYSQTPYLVATSGTTRLD